MNDFKYVTHPYTPLKEGKIGIHFFEFYRPSLISLKFGVKCLIIGFFITGFCSCTDHPVSPEPEPPVKININFHHLINQQEIDFDTLKYINDASNQYLVNEIQYFVSDIILYHSSGTSKLIEDWTDIHYVDTDLPETWQWAIYDDFEAGVYDSVSFTFGISEEKNISFMYVNPPEKDMFWPEFLGGGYHYMKLNGKWLPEGQTIQTTPFDFHLGIGQEYASYPDSIIGFIHNHFRVSLPNSGFEVSSGETKNLNLTMHVERWFKEPNLYDHDIFGGYIMQNQEAMQKVKENGQNVFTFEAN